MRSNETRSNWSGSVGSACASFSNFSCVKFLETEWGSWDSGRVRKFSLELWSYESIIHNSKYFLCGRCNRGWVSDLNKVDFVSTMLRSKELC